MRQKALISVRDARKFFGNPVFYSNIELAAGGHEARVPEPPAQKERARRLPGSSSIRLWSARGRGFRRGYEAQLLEHAELVLNLPVLDDLPVFDPGDMDRLPCRGLTAWRHPGKFALHRAGGCRTRHHQVTLGDLKIDRDLEIWKSASQRLNQKLETFLSGRHAWRQSGVVDGVIGDHLVDDLELALVESFQRDTRGYCLVLLRHIMSSLVVDGGFPHYAFCHRLRVNGSVD